MSCRTAPTRSIPGHEFAGTVVAVGSDVTEFAEGDRIAADPNIFCGECHYCLIGRGNLCIYYGALGVTRDGACAEFLAVPVGNCFALPDSMPLEHAPLIEPLSCAVHGFDLLPGRVGEHYLIYGAGTMGLMMAQLAQRAGAASVSVVDINTSRLEVARRPWSRCDRPTRAAEFDRPHGWEVVVDCTGVIPAIEDALTRVRPGGTMQVFGVAAADAKASFSPFDVYKNEITIVGSMAVLHSFGRCRGPDGQERASTPTFSSVTGMAWTTTPKPSMRSVAASDASSRFDRRPERPHCSRPRSGGHQGDGNACPLTEIDNHCQ